jgi:hypothetical protein
MPRPRLALRCYATFHGQMLIGPYADPDQVELEAWAELRQRCAHLDQGCSVLWAEAFVRAGFVVGGSSQQVRC